MPKLPGWLTSEKTESIDLSQDRTIRMEHYEVSKDGHTARVTISDHEGVYQIDIPWREDMTPTQMSEMLSQLHFGETPFREWD